MKHYVQAAFRASLYIETLEEHLPGSKEVMYGNDDDLRELKYALGQTCH